MIPNRNLVAWKTKQNRSKNQKKISKKVLDVAKKIEPNTFEISTGVDPFLNIKMKWKLKK